MWTEYMLEWNTYTNCLVSFCGQTFSIMIQDSANIPSLYSCSVFRFLITKRTITSRETYRIWLEKYSSTEISWNLDASMLHLTFLNSNFLLRVSPHMLPLYYQIPYHCSTDNNEFYYDYDRFIHSICGLFIPQHWILLSLFLGQTENIQFFLL